MANSNESTVNTIKCANCNLVINEVLTFIQNKCDVMDEDSIIRLCVTAFKPEEISAAKNLLFSSISKTPGRKINRKREGKMQRELEDIIMLIKQKDPEEMPIFVARDLQKLPPVTFDHLDATRLLKDLISLKHEIETIKETYTHESQFLILKSQVIGLQESFTEHNFERENFVNRKRGANRMSNKSDLDCESGPTGYNHNTQELMNAENCSVDTDKGIIKQPSRTKHSPSLSRPCAPPLSSSHSSARTAQQLSQCTGDDAAINTGLTSAGAGAPKEQLTRTTSQSAIRQSANEEWQVVRRKKYRNRFVSKKGTCTEIVDTFKAAAISVPLFINNVHKGTSENNIVSYILSKTNVKITLQKVEPK